MEISKKQHTYFAPAERDPENILYKQREKIKASEFLDQILAETPFMFLILNENRQVVYSNHLLINHLGYKYPEEFIGSRPGELFKCIHSEKEVGGCGTAKNCRYCGAIHTILESKKTNRMIARDTIINMNIKGKERPGNYKVTSRPFLWQGETFFIVTLEDISSTKRKEQLERTFFHDIKNKAGTVKGFLHLLNERGQDEKESMFIKYAKRGVDELLNEIEHQHKLLDAEKGTLQLSYEVVNLPTILKDVSNDFTNLAERNEIIIETDLPADDLKIKTDLVILKRILTNLVKNAIEASKKNDKIKIGYFTDSNRIIIRVENPAIMPVDIQYQIFNKSFSTKGPGRGIGAYSIKLFTEEYLKGKVYFTSREGEGTVFYVSLPELIE